MADPELRATLREESARFLTTVADPSWARVAALGWPGIEIPEEHGGLGLSFAETCLLLEEQGRVLHRGPYFATAVLGVGALLGATEEQRAAWLPRIASGEAIVTAAVDGGAGAALTLDARGSGPDSRGSAPGARGSAADTPGSAADTPGPAPARLTGAIAFVPDLDVADAVVVAAGDALFLVSASDLEPVAQPTHDRTRSLFSAHLRGVAADPMPGSAQTLRDRAAIALAADCVGGAAAALDMTVAYLQDRRQFGKPIGAFQALQHRAADMLLALENARSAAAHAATDPTPAAASIAKSVAGEAFVHVAAETVSLHGGIGFTWEHDAHRFLKRAKLNQAWMGDTGAHRERLARLALGMEA